VAGVGSKKKKKEYSSGGTDGGIPGGRTNNKWSKGCHMPRRTEKTKRNENVHNFVGNLDWGKWGGEKGVMVPTRELKIKNFFARHGWGGVREKRESSTKGRKLESKRRGIGGKKRGKRKKKTTEASLKLNKRIRN